MRSRDLEIELSSCEFSSCLSCMLLLVTFFLAFCVRFDAAGAVFVSLPQVLSLYASLQQALYLFRCRMCVCCFVAAGVIFVWSVAAGAFFISAPQMCSLFASSQQPFFRFVAAGASFVSLPQVRSAFVSVPQAL